MNPLIHASLSNYPSVLLVIIMVGRLSSLQEIQKFLMSTKTIWSYCLLSYSANVQLYRDYFDLNEENNIDR